MERTTSQTRQDTAQTPKDPGSVDDHPGDLHQEGLLILLATTGRWSFEADIIRCDVLMCGAVTPRLLAHAPNLSQPRVRGPFPGLLRLPAACAALPGSRPARTASATAAARIPAIFLRPKDVATAALRTSRRPSRAIGQLPGMLTIGAMKLSLFHGLTSAPHVLGELAWSCTGIDVTNSISTIWNGQAAWTNFLSSHLHMNRVPSLTSGMSGPTL